MTALRTSVDFNFRSGGGPTYYYFTVTLDQTGSISVRDIQTPTGAIIDSYTPIPQSVQNDIQAAIAQVGDLVNQTSAINGQLVFTGQTDRTVTFVTPMLSTNYRVVYSTLDFIPVRTTSKTTTGFTVDVGVTYTGTVGFDVFI